MTGFSHNRTFDDRWYHQPLRDVVRLGASLREAGFAQSIDQMVHVFGIRNRKMFAHKCGWNAGLSLFQPVQSLLRLFILTEMGQC